MDTDGAVQMILDRIYKRDSLSMMSFVFDQLQDLPHCPRTASELFKSFGTRFAAQLPKYNSISTSTAIFQCMTAFYLLETANLEETQRIAIMAAVAPDNLSDVLKEGGRGRARLDSRVELCTHTSLVHGLLLSSRNVRELGECAPSV